MLLTETHKVFVMGSNNNGQLGLDNSTFITPFKLSQGVGHLPSLNLATIKETSMDNSAVNRGQEDQNGLKEYIMDLETKIREGDSSKETIMTETLVLINKAETIANEMAKFDPPYSKKVAMVAQLDKVK